MNYKYQEIEQIPPEQLKKLALNESTFGLDYKIGTRFGTPK